MNVVWGITVKDLASKTPTKNYCIDYSGGQRECEVRDVQLLNSTNNLENEIPVLVLSTDRI